MNFIVVRETKSTIGCVRIMGFKGSLSKKESMATTKPKKSAPKTASTPAKAKAKVPTKAPAKVVAKPTAKPPAKKPVVAKTTAKTPVKVAAAKKPAKAPAKSPAKVADPKKRAAPVRIPAAKPTAKAAPAKASASISQTSKAPVKSASVKTTAPNAANFKPYVPKKGEIYMSKEQLAHFAEILTRLKDELLADIERTVHTMQDEQTVFADPNDRASQETDMALELRNRDRERKLIKKIEETLGRIRADDYGYCDKCGIEIGVQRLEARPTATLCIDCKTLEELREKQVAK